MGYFWGLRLVAEIGRPHLRAGLPVPDRTPRQEIVARPLHLFDGPIFIGGDVLLGNLYYIDDV